MELAVQIYWEGHMLPISNLKLKYTAFLNVTNPRQALAILTQALVTFWSDYCNVLYMGLTLESIWKLQGV